MVFKKYVKKQKYATLVVDLRAPRTHPRHFIPIRTEKRVFKTASDAYSVTEM
jgi:hypothetical protein